MLSNLRRAGKEGLAASCILADMRVPAVALLVFLVLIPQLVCFLPSEDMTQSESDCCKHMAGDCGEANMQGHSCCTGMVRPDVAIATQTHRQFIPHSELVATPHVSETPDVLRLVVGAATLAQRDIHAPPADPATSSPVLRI